MTTHVFISPHFDDVVGSCAGVILRLRRAGHEVRVLTVFGGVERPPFSDVASSLHRAWGLDNDVVIARRSEDESACRALDATAGFLDFPDCIYRTNGSGRHLYPTFAALTGPADEADLGLAERIAERLDRLVPAGDAIVYSPAAVGNHVDHVTTRRAVEMLRSGRAPVLYYREFFYERFADVPPPSRSHVVKLTLQPDEVARKISAFTAYRSQIKSLFGNDDELRRYFTTSGRIEEVFIPAEVPSALRDDLVRILGARVGSPRLRMIAQALSAPSRRWRAAAMRASAGPAGAGLGTRLRRLVFRKIRLMYGRMHRLSGKQQ